MIGLAELMSCVSGEGGAVRAGCLERYREKKRRRLHSSIIRYEKRKVNADNRHAPAPLQVCRGCTSNLGQASDLACCLNHPPVWGCPGALGLSYVKKQRFCSGYAPRYLQPVL